MASPQNFHVDLKGSLIDSNHFSMSFWLVVNDKDVRLAIFASSNGKAFHPSGP
jgi:hypothetical protein